MRTQGPGVSREGEPVELRCIFSVSPRAARITWTRNDESIATIANCTGNALTSCDIDLDPGSRNHAFSGGLNSGINLNLLSVSLEDDGIYECKVIATEGYGKSSVELIITSKYSLPFPRILRA